MHACYFAESVAERSEAVNSKLQLRRDQIEELSQVKNLLTKLQAVFDLPRRLRSALDREAYEVAADAFADAAPLLKKYGHKVGEVLSQASYLQMSIVAYIAFPRRLPVPLRRAQGRLSSGLPCASASNKSAHRRPFMAQAALLL